MSPEATAAKPRMVRILCTVSPLMTAGLAVLILAAFDRPSQPPPVSNSAAGSECLATPEGELERIIARDDFSALREHAWNKLLTISAPYSPSDDPGWLDWPQKFDVFHPTDLSARRWRFEESLKDRLADAVKHRTPLDLADLVNQLRDDRVSMSASKSTATRPAQVSELKALSIVSFNSFAADWIMRKEHQYYQRDNLDALRDAHFIDIPAFPRESIVTKQTWWPIASDRPCPIPVWDGEVDLCTPTKVDDNAPFTNWPRIAVLDDSNNEGELIEVKYPARAGSSRFGRRVHRSRILFRSFRQLKQPPTEEARLHFCSLYGRDPTLDDGVGLVAMHFITKELPDWLWCTIWWHDEPHVGRYAADRPSSIPPPWNNYLLQVAFDADRPREEDGTPSIAFNPWLEGRLQGATSSNCLACHQRAVWPLDGVHSDLQSRGRIPRTDCCAFCLHGKARMRVDYLWSVSMEAN